MRARRLHVRSSLTRDWAGVPSALRTEHENQEQHAER